MRCRYCRKELSVLKKLADTDFCSADHRDLFLQDQQQRMLDLLARSRQRLNSRRVSKARPLVDPNPAPAPPWHFVRSDIPAAAPRAHAGTILGFLSSSSWSLPILNVRLTTKQRDADLVPGPFVTLADWISTQLIRVSEPAVVTAPRTPALLSSLATRELAYGRLLRGRPRTGRDRLLSRVTDLTPLGLAHAPELPRLYLHVAGDSVPEECAPPIRSRSGAPVYCGTLKPAEYVTPSPGPWTVAARVPLARLSAPDCSPHTAGRAELFVPCAIVVGATRFSPTTHCDFAAQSRIASIAGVLPDRSLPDSTGLFSMNPGTGAAVEGRWQSIAPSATEFMPFLAVSTAAEVYRYPAPRLSARLFRAKPRAGVPDAKVASVLARTAAIPCKAAEPLLPRLACHVTGVSVNAIPPAITRPWPMRPRTGISCASLAQFRTITPFANTDAAALAFPRISSDPAHWVPPSDPRQCGMQANGPVNDSDFAPDRLARFVEAMPEAGTTSPVISAASLPWTGELPATSRLFRMRPRSGVATTEARVLGLIAPSPLRVSGRQPHLGLATRVPRRIERLYRMRPRAGLNSASVGPHFDSSPALACECPAVEPPVSRLLPCAPQAAGRLFRMRPRNPVPSGLAPDVRTVELAPAEPSEIFVMPPVPQLRVEWAFELRRPDRPARLKPPGPLGGIGGGGMRTPGDEDEDANPAMVARSTVGPSFPTLHLPPFAPPVPARPLLDRIRDYFFGWPNWLNTPALRLAGCSLPVLAAIAVYAAATSPVSHRNRLARAAEPPLMTTVTSVRDKMAARSAIEYRDDFSSGLHDWDGGRGWSDTWSYDESGGVKVGAAALLKPTLDLTDYAFEFAAQIDQSGLGFLARAADIDNGYAVKLIVARPGPVPAVDIVRYALVGGKPQNRVEKRLPMTVYNDTIYNVRLDVREDNYSLSVNGRLVDAWTDARFPAGGVGLFTAKGERARFLNVRISHQDDAIGRALAFVVKDSSQPAKRISR